MGREPYVLRGRSLLDPTQPVTDIVDELMAAGHDVIADESGMFMLFLDADDAETLLTDTRFRAVAMPVLHMSGIFDGPLHDLWSNLMFGKDGD